MLIEFENTSLLELNEFVDVIKEYVPKHEYDAFQNILKSLRNFSLFDEKPIHMERVDEFRYLMTKLFCEVNEKYPRILMREISCQLIKINGGFFSITGFKILYNQNFIEFRPIGLDEYSQKVVKICSNIDNLEQTIKTNVGPWINNEGKLFLVGTLIDQFLSSVHEI